MQLPSILQGVSPTRLLQGAVAGAIATVVIGFSWGGWVTGGAAKEMAQKGVSSALVSALSPICVDRFKAQRRRGREPDRIQEGQLLAARLVHREGGLDDDAQRRPRELRGGASVRDFVGRPEIIACSQAVFAFNAMAPPAREQHGWLPSAYLEWPGQVRIFACSTKSCFQA
jgi:hypothetical protein